MNKINLIFAIILSLIAFAGCGKSKSSDSNVQPYKENYESEEEVEKVFKEYETFCSEEKKKCPSFAAQLVIKSIADGEYSLSLCSGTLFNNRFIITNSHCIPKEVVNNPMKCSNQLKINFPETHLFPAESVKCKKLIQSYDYENGEPDLAVIELDRDVFREPVKIRKNAFVEDAKVMAFTANPGPQKSLYGTITKKTCNLSTDNLMTLSNRSDNDQAVVYGFTCDILDRNSGSAVFNEQFEMIGVVRGRFKILDLKKSYETLKLTHSFYKPTGIIQNIGCLRSVTTNSGIDCDYSQKTLSDFNNHLESKIDELNNLSGRRSIKAPIIYDITDGFKLKLQRSLILSPSQYSTLEFFRSTWVERYYSAKRSNELLILDFQK